MINKQLDLKKFKISNTNQSVYINPAAVLSILETDTGCTLNMTDGKSFEVEAEADEIAEWVDKFIY